MLRAPGAAVAAILLALAPTARAQITEFQLTSAPTDQHGAWSPDGATILFNSQRSGNLDIWSVPSTGGTATRLTGNTLVDQHPDWSPDGTRFVFSANAGAGTDLYTRPLSGGATLLDADPAAADLFPSWSPDSLSIAYEKAGDIYVISLLDSSKVQLTTDPADDSHPSWSPDGTQIVFRSSRSGNDDLWIVPAAGGPPVPFTSHLADDNAPDWSPRGDLIVFSSARGGGRNLWVKPAAGGTATQLTFAGVADTEPDWGPDGRSIVFTRAGGVGLFTISFPLADLAVTKTVNNPAPQELSNITYTVVLSNAGPDSATGVEVADLLPAGLTFLSSTVTTGAYDSLSGVWSVGTVDSAGTETLTITAKVDAATAGQVFTNTATVTSPDVVDAFPDNQSDSVDITSRGIDLGLFKTVDNQTPAEGATITYTILLTNSGTDPATGVEISDPVPPGLTFQSASPSVGTYSTITSNWSSLGTVEAGSTDTLTITATVQAGTTGNTITNTATVSAVAQTDNNPANDFASIGLVPGAIDLAVSQTVSDPNPDEGDSLSFTVTLLNDGSMAATGIEVTDLLPAGITYTGDAPTAGTYSSITGIWTLASLGIGASEDLVLSGTVDAGTAGQVLTNVATVTLSDQTDPVSGNDTSALGVPVTAVDLSVTKMVDDPTPAEGAAIQYRVVALNLGPDDATGVGITDLLPSGVTYVSDTATAGTYNSGTGLWSLGALASGIADTLLVDATVDAGTSAQTIVNTAFVSQRDQGDPNAANDSAAVNILVGALDISVAMTVSNLFPNAGEVITFQIIATNLGPNPATNLNLSDLLVSALTYQSDTASQGIYTPGTGLWNIPALAVGAADTLALTVLVDGATPGAMVNNTVSLAGLDQIDTNPVNDLRSLVITVGAMVTEAQLTNAPTDRRPVWAPNGSMVLFDSDRSGNKDVWSIPLPLGSGSAVRRTFSGLVDQHPSWAPSGPMFVYSANAGAGTDLYVRSIAGGGATLLDADPSAADIYPAWSPDSLRIAYDKGGDIWLYTLAGGAKQQLTTDPADDSHPSWSPDGSEIVFRSDRSGNADLWIIPSAGGTPVQLTNDPAADAEPEWSPAGNLIAFSSGRTGNRDIFVMPAAGGTAVQMTTAPDDDLQPGWSPAGNQLAIARVNNQGGLFILTFPVTDLDVDQTVDTPLPAEGATVTYTVSVRNFGPEPATGVEVTDVLPAGVTFQSASATAGSYSAVGGAWDLGALSVGAADTLLITATVDSATTGQTITNVAQVTLREQLDGNSANDSASVDILVTDGVVSVDTAGFRPRVFSLAQGRPTPFRDRTRIQFDLPAAARADLVIYSVTGRRVRSLVNERLDAGRYVADWDGRDVSGHRVAAGVYFVRLRAGDFTATRKAVLLR